MAWHRTGDKPLSIANSCLVYWHIYVLLGMSELKISSNNFNFLHLSQCQKNWYPDAKHTEPWEISFETKHKSFTYKIAWRYLSFTVDVIIENWVVHMWLEFLLDLREAHLAWSWPLHHTNSPLQILVTPYSGLLVSGQLWPGAIYNFLKQWTVLTDPNGTGIFLSYGFLSQANLQSECKMYTVQAIAMKCKVKWHKARKELHICIDKP